MTTDDEVRVLLNNLAAARDEVERLTARVETVTTANSEQSAYFRDLLAERDAAQAEVERLRAYIGTPDALTVAEVAADMDRLRCGHCDKPLELGKYHADYYVRLVLRAVAEGMPT